MGDGRPYASGNGFCIIDSCIYGKDEDKHKVGIVREFRDNVLNRSSLGKSVVELYYSEFGKKAANLIVDKFPSAVPLFKQCLDYVVRKYEKNLVGIKESQ